MMQSFNQLVQFVQQGISAIFRFVHTIWTWSVGQIMQVVQSPWQSWPLWKQICHRLGAILIATVAILTARANLGIRVASDDFRMLSGEPTIYAKTAESGAKSAQAFCPRCGSPIYAARFGDAPKFYNIRLGTVRQRDQFVPKLQFWSRSELHWLPSLATIRKIEKQEWRTAPRSPA